MCLAKIRAFLVVFLLGAAPALAIDGATPIPFTSPVTYPITISTGGKYTVTGSLTAPPGAEALIVITTAADVVLDLGGHTLDNSANPGSAVIAVVGGAGSEVAIRNGNVMGGSAGISVPAGAAEIVVDHVKVSDTGVGVLLGSPFAPVASFAIRSSVILRTSSNAIVAEGTGPKQGTIADNLIQGSHGGIAICGGSSVAILNNRLERIAPNTDPWACPPAISTFRHGGILLATSDDCLVSNNTIENVAGGNGMRILNTHGCKFYNNVVMKISGDGMIFDSISFDNLILDNVVVHAGWDGVAVTGHFDGIRVMTIGVGGNHVGRNVLNRNGLYGLHFTKDTAVNHYGRNTGVGNGMAPGAPPCPTPTPGASPFDLCSEGLNFSFGDNLMPGPGVI